MSRPDHGAAPVSGGREPDKDISFYINSPGGVVSAGLAIYDTMQYIRPDVSTLCFGQAPRWARSARRRRARQALLPAACQHHDSPALGRFRGPAADIEIQATEILKWRDRLDRIYAKHTGQDSRSS